LNTICGTNLLTQRQHSVASLHPLLAFTTTTAATTAAATAAASAILFAAAVLDAAAADAALVTLQWVTQHRSVTPTTT
jgi:hypothetical protein